MPRSPFTLLLMVLTLVAFAAHLFLLDTQGSPSAMLLSAGVLLAVAATASIVRDGGAFDSRAFHRTRPRGDSRAFRNSTLRLAGLATAVAVMGLAYLVVFNVGWLHGSRFGLELALPVGFSVASCATGFTLILSSDSRRVLTSLLLILPPVVVALVLSELHIGSFPGYGMPSYLWGYFYTSTWASLLGIAGYSLSWWLAARRRRRRAALMLACLTGACLPLAQRLGFLPSPGLPLMPERTLEITRTIPTSANPSEEQLRKLSREEYANRRGWSKEMEERSARYVPIFLAGRLEVKGLKENEFLWSPWLVPSTKKGRDWPAVMAGQGWFEIEEERAELDEGYGGLILHDDSSLETGGRQSLMNHLIRQLPVPSQFEEESRQGQYLDWISVDEKQTSIEAVETSAWQVDGVVYRMEESGSFEVSRGGRYRMPSGGTVIMRSFPRAGDPSRIGIRMIDSPRFADEARMGYRTSGFPETPLALLRDPLSGDTRVLTFAQDGSEFAMMWRYYFAYAGIGGRDVGPDPEFQKKLMRSRLYLFRAVPIGRVNVALPPPVPSR